MSPHHERPTLIGVSPFTEPNAPLVVAVARAGHLGVLDLGRDADAARRALDDVRRWWPGSFGVRVVAGCPLTPADLPEQVDTVILGIDASSGQGASWDVGAYPARTLVEVGSVADARQATRAAGLIARGNESGGRVGDSTTFVLLQQLLADPAITAPIWAAGGIGPHTAAAAIAGGAAGVVLDTQLALVSECELAEPIAAAVRAMDGSETTLIGGHRLYTRPDLPVAHLPADTAPGEIAGRLGARDLRTQLLAVGQDAPIAVALADRYRTAGGVLAAVDAAISGHMRTAVTVEPLAPTAGRYPIAQGPMTRVSDRAGFAAAVAADGGLPFLALALMSGAETRELLHDAADRLSGRAWGVGVLGFAAPEIRSAQLDAVLAVKPPYALIAGGRPAQAAPLEAAGISTYLHVPSPGLLDRFLAEGARKFVFEGRECGGHVGPRASFPLWEIQLQRLLSFGEQSAVGELDVLFAGGVHDARSAAMVAAMTAPLAERGAKIGVLMGTAYLFTAEAVTAGAVQPGFQQAALECERTVLLETSPGHAVRCADSPFVATFAAAKAELAAAGTPADQAWEQLEQLNLGRLRIASKGLVRSGGELVDVDADHQRSEGMFMLGEVAALRSGTTTIAELHADVCTGGTELLARRAAALGLGPAAEPATEPLDIAIVGMAAILPGAADVGEYWSAILHGDDKVTEVPADRWDPAQYYDPAGTGRHSPSKWGGFLPDVPFDALAYGIPPASLASIEPVQLLALEVSARAIADAGYSQRPFDRSRTAVIFGAEAGTDLSGAYGFRSMYPAYLGPLPAELDAQLPALTEDSFPGVLANIIAGRVANRLDLGGANYTVDAACASSLAALDAACKELRTGAADMVICGGADTHNGIHDYLLFASVHALSPTGRCRPFDASADGIALGEGVAAVVLKRLADAERDGDRIYAVVKGVGGASDGRSLGLTAPRPAGQRLAIDRAYAAAGISPAQVGVVEAHGTGTVVGDRTELATLTEVFTEAGAAVGECTLGSVKSQIGHTKCAAGLAGLIKTARALHTGVRPPTLHVGSPNPYHDAAVSPFTFDRSPRPWTAPAAERAAGVSAFGFGGTNFHAVLTAYASAPEPAHGLDEWPAELFLVRDLDALEERVAANDRAGRPWRLRDLARTTAGGSGPLRAAMVADDLDDLAAKLRLVRSGADGDAVFRPGAAAGQVAFLFPGQGSQRPGMLGELFMAFPRLQRFLHLGRRWAPTMFPPAARSPEESAAQRAALTDTRVAQPALGVAGLAAHELLGTFGVRPDMAAGHSYGELVALCVAGVIDRVDLLPLSEARGAAILTAAGEDPGTMAAVTAPADTVSTLLAARPECAGVVIANHNTPQQTVISGPTPAVGTAVEALAAAGISAQRIAVACAFHSPLVAGAAGRLGAELDRLELGTPAFDVWSNTTAGTYPGAAPDAAALLARQVAEPVRFVEQIEAMYDAGARVFVEAGAGRVLTGLVGSILGDRPHTAVPLDRPGESGIRGLLLALAQLAAAGVPVEAGALFRGRDAHLVRADQAPRRPGWLVNGHLVRTADGEHLPGGLRPAKVVAVPATAPAPSGDAAVLEFLRASRELVAAQREVLLGYLGSRDVAPRLAPALEAAPARAAAPALDALPVVAELPAPVAVSAAPVLTPERILATVLTIVSERTGYPLDMLDPDLDLEADLSIDSIKRTEVLAELTDRIGLSRTGSGGIDEAAVEQLARLKTLRGIVDWLVTRTAGSDTVSATEPGPEAAEPEPLRRYVVRVGALDAVEPAPGQLAGRRIGLVEDGIGVALELADQLRAHGADVRLLGRDGWTELDDPPHTLVHLGALDPTGPPVLPDGFAELKAAALGGLRELVVVTGCGGRFGHNGAIDTAGAPTGAGLHGLIRTLGREVTGLSARAVDLNPKDEPSRLARHLLAELGQQTPTVVGYTDGHRAALQVLAEALPTTGAPENAARELGLDADSVVLLTGGARGITAQVALGLARASGCHVELVGRTALPAGAEDPATASALDRVALRRALIAAGVTVPAQVEAMTSRLLAERELRATIAELSTVAASVRYSAVDVRDRAAVAALIEDIHARHGRLDGVIHGAGVLEDRLLRDKTPESFARVWSTKVDGAHALAESVRPDLGFLVLFGSVSGVFGNRGQADYSAANDALDTFARSWSHRFGGRVVAMDWGPWAPAAGGMVSPELQREYASRGIGVIEHPEGVAALLAELAWGAPDTPQVVYMCGEPAAFEGRPADG